MQHARYRPAVRATALLALCLAAGSPAPAQDAPAVDGPPLFEEVARTTKRLFWDQTFGGRDFDAIVERHRARARELAGDPRALRAHINAMLGELKTSHLGLLEPEVWTHHLQPELTGKATPQLGVEWVRLGNVVRVAAVWDGGPGERAGLRRGDRLLAIDGVPPLEHPRFLPGGSDPGLPSPPGYYLVVDDDGAPDVLTMARWDGTRYTARPEPERMTMLDAARRSVRVIEWRGRRVGYVHLWHFLHSGMTRVLRDAIAGEFADCDALVLDVRGRGGMPMVLFNLLRQVRDARRAGAPWASRCATLIDGGSRSAKEIWAWRFKHEALGPVIGRRTEGAVIAAQFRPMDDGSALMVPMADVRGMTGGELLEGVGVAPHFEVEGDLADSRGRDEILDRALEILWEQFGLAAPARAAAVARPAVRRRVA